jgi:hypothetical protein
MQRRRVTDCCKPKETYLALLPQSLESWHHVIEHLLNAERFPPPVSVIALCRWKMSTWSRRSRARLPSSDFVTCLGNAMEVGAGYSDFRDTKLRILKNYRQTIYW